MNKKIFPMILTIFLIGFVSSIEINLTSGNSYSFDSGTTEQIYYKINGIDLNYLNISQNGSLINITLSKYTPNSNFNIDFYVLKESSSSSSSSGSSSSLYKIEKLPSDKTIFNCDFGAKKCVNKELWSCNDGEWGFVNCEYKCEDGECVLETSKELEKDSSILFLIIIESFFLIGLILLMIIIISSNKKRNMPKGSERRKK